jgi:plasmid stabilization system protein ParE
VAIKVGHQPQIGRPVEDMPDEYREWLIDCGDSSYVARYRFDGVSVTILAVRHQNRLAINFLFSVDTYLRVTLSP